MPTSETWNNIPTRPILLILKPDSVDICQGFNRSQFGTVNVLHSDCANLGQNL